MTAGRRSSLRWQLGVQAALLLLGAGLLAVMAVVSLSVARREYGVAAAGYRELTRVYEVGAQVRSARTLASVGNGAGAVRELQVARRRLEAMERNEMWRAVEVALIRADGGDVAAIDEVTGSLSRLATAIQKEITADERRADERRGRVAVAVVIGALVLAALASLAALVQYRRVVKPLGELASASRALAGRDFSLRLSESGPEELARLAADFNRMASELEGVYRDLEAKVDSRSRALAESSRLASVGYLAAGVAHEINNPLGIITGYAERAARDGVPMEKVRQSLAVITEEAYRCHRITRALLTLAKPVEANEKARCELVGVVRSVVERLSVLPVAQGRELVVRDEGPVEVAASEGDVGQVVTNLVVNALEAGRRVEVAISREGTMRVSDDGPGIAEGIRGRLFEPFVTTKGGEGKNLGLGLMVVRTVTTSVGASVEVGTSLLEGAEFVVKWKR